MWINHRAAAIQDVMPKGFCCSFVRVEPLVASDPNRPGSILEKRIYEDAAQAFGLVCFVFEHAKAVAIEPV